MLSCSSSLMFPQEFLNSPKVNQCFLSTHFGEENHLWVVEGSSENGEFCKTNRVSWQDFKRYSLPSSVPISLGYFEDWRNDSNSEVLCCSNFAQIWPSICLREAEMCFWHPSFGNQFLSCQNEGGTPILISLFALHTSTPNILTLTAAAAEK